VKIVIFGASGKIGTAVANLLSPEHEVIKVSRSGDIATDYLDPVATEAVFQQVSGIDAVVVAVGGDSQFKPYHELTDDDIRYGAERKLVAQFRIVSLAEKYLNQGGSVTLTSGFLSHYPNPSSLGTGPFNAAIDTYVRQSADLLDNGLRLNVVSPAPVVEPNRVRTGLVSALQVAEYYVRSITSQDTGTVYRAWGGLDDTNDQSAH